MYAATVARTQAGEYVDIYKVIGFAPLREVQGTEGTESWDVRTYWAHRFEPRFKFQEHFFYDDEDRVDVDDTAGCVEKHSFIGMGAHGKSSVYNLAKCWLEGKSVYAEDAQLNPDKRKFTIHEIALQGVPNFSLLCTDDDEFSGRVGGPMFMTAQAEFEAAASDQKKKRKRKT